jgi:hypothetical protein
MWNNPPEMKNESQSLKRGETTFRRKGEILLQSWRDTRVVNMISTIHEVKGVKENTLLGGATFVPPTKKEEKLSTSASSA